MELLGIELVHSVDLLEALLFSVGDLFPTRIQTGDRLLAAVSDLGAYEKGRSMVTKICAEDGEIECQSEAQHQLHRIHEPVQRLLSWAGPGRACCGREPGGCQDALKL